MKKIILLFMMLGLFNLTKGQNWVNHGAVWHYYAESQYLSRVYKYEYLNDTSIQGHNCQHIQLTIYFFAWQSTNYYVSAGSNQISSYYTYNQGDTVYFLTDSGFAILYDFGATTGETWVLSNDTSGGCLPSVVTVTGSGTMLVNGATKRWVDVTSHLGAKYYLAGRIVEGIGIAKYKNGLYPNDAPLFPWKTPCDTISLYEFFGFNFQCFTDSLTPLYNPSGKECDYLVNHVGIQSFSNQIKKITCFPNPVSSSISIVYNNKMLNDTEIEIFDLMGKNVKTAKIDSNGQVDISELTHGIYFLKVFSADGEVFIGKVVKE